MCGVQYISLIVTRMRYKEINSGYYRQGRKNHLIYLILPFKFWFKWIHFSIEHRSPQRKIITDNNQESYYGTHALSAQHLRKLFTNFGQLSQDPGYTNRSYHIGWAAWSLSAHLLSLVYNSSVTRPRTVSQISDAYPKLTATSTQSTDPIKDVFVRKAKVIGHQDSFCLGPFRSFW
jgi:hypothetical protein